VAREVGTEGILGGQAEVRGVSGTWRELTDNVNLMARNLTEQVRGIARVVTAVAKGDLEQQLRFEAKGEIATLVETINDMIVTLSTFADQVSGVARDVGVEGRLGGQADVPGAAGIWRDLTRNVNELAGNLTRQVRAIGDVATAVTKGDLTQSIDVEARGEVAILKDNLNQMITTLADTTQVNEEQDWLKTNLTRFTRMLQGQRDLLTVAQQVLSELAPVVGAQHGAFYMTRTEDERQVLKLFASYAYTERKQVSSRFEPGQGLVGQASIERKRITVTDVPGDYIVVGSGLGEAKPLNIVVVPILFEDSVKGVIELATFQAFTKIQLAFIDQLLESLGIVIATIEATMRTDELLRQSQSMAEELQTQQEELQQTNEELEEKARQLTAQKDEVERKNQEVETAKAEVEEKAEQLALTSRYKSQFLANMSHELRTPLNSLLILSRQLSDNPQENLSEKQVQYAQTIHQAGADLLALINEILDLAKIESGTISISPEPVRFESLEEFVERSFRQVAEEKDLGFHVELDEELPETLTTDDMRLRQVLRNLLSNAFKFTHEGEVNLSMRRLDAAPRDTLQSTLRRAGTVVAFAVTDSGIGISPDKQQIVFEAFQQADGGTSRKYGGTGLGLSISREIALLLGGDLTVESAEGEGSTFTLYLPLEYRPQEQRPEARKTLQAPTRRALQLTDGRSGSKRAPSANAVATDNEETTNNLSVPRLDLDDDRHDLQAGDRVLLIVEDEKTFATILLELARERGFRGVVAGSGTEALDLARSLKPDAITLDLGLPDMDGWVLLDRLKHEPATRHIPIHIISAAGEEHRGREVGAVAVLAKPVEREALVEALGEIQTFLERRVKKLLVVEDDERQRDAILELVGNGDVVSTPVSSGEEALEALADEQYDCMVLDLKLPGMSGTELIQTIKDDPALARLPIVVYTGQELTREEQTGLSRLAETIIIKDVRSPERLLDETALFLHRLESELPEPKRQMLRSLVHGDPSLAGKRVLVVDDDVRNIFAITAVLEQHQMDVIYAENGREALEQLDEHDDTDIVLMDIMMPEMDGYEATRAIRDQPDLRDLPVIALTAKAMKGDREKCIEAGASDYITKPVDPDQLISLLRVWLYR
jgi:CheY-like chemotaxis protein/HAMP domain-containing protein